MNIWSRNNMLLKNQRVNEEINKEARKYLKTNQNGNKTFQNLWDAAKAILRGKFITIQAYFKNKEKSQETIQHVIQNQKKKDKAQSHQKEEGNKEEIETKINKKETNKKHNRKCQ